jgi:hypothetical protein
MAPEPVLASTRFEPKTLVIQGLSVRKPQAETVLPVGVGRGEGTEIQPSPVA